LSAATNQSAIWLDVTNAVSRRLHQKVERLLQVEGAVGYAQHMGMHGQRQNARLLSPPRAQTRHRCFKPLQQLVARLALHHPDRTSLSSKV
jgi:hypothetical protein